MEIFKATLLSIAAISATLLVIILGYLVFDNVQHPDGPVRFMFMQLMACAAVFTGMMAHTSWREIYES